VNPPENLNHTKSHSTKTMTPSTRKNKNSPSSPLDKPAHWIAIAKASGPPKERGVIVSGRTEARVNERAIAGHFGRGIPSATSKALRAWTLSQATPATASHKTFPRGWTLSWKPNLERL